MSRITRMSLLNISLFKKIKKIKRKLQGLFKYLV